MPVQVTGVSTTLAGMKALKGKAPIVIAEGLEKAAYIILRKANTLVPFETGALQASGRVEKNTGVGMAAKVSVEYGGPTAPYALWVHEHLDKKHKAPTTAKFLTKAVSLSRGTIVAMMRRQVSAKLGKTIDGKVVK